MYIVNLLNLLASHTRSCTWNETCRLILLEHKPTSVDVVRGWQWKCETKVNIHTYPITQTSSVLQAIYYALIEGNKYSFKESSGIHYGIFFITNMNTSCILYLSTITIVQYYCRGLKNRKCYILYIRMTITGIQNINVQHQWATLFRDC